MPSLQQLLDDVCVTHQVPGAVALVSRDGDTEVACAGNRTVAGEPMTRDTVFRIASATKPIVAAATMVLVEREVLGLDDEVAGLLPELAEPMVLRTIDGPVDDVVPAQRPITVRDLLTFQAGHGFPTVDSPAVRLLVERLGEGPPRPQKRPQTEQWMRRLSEIPLLHQPGEGWTYNTGSEILGVLLARAAEAPLQDVLADTLLEPLEMRDTGFWAEDTGRLASLYARADGDLELVDPPAGQWAQPPPFPSGGGGLLSTADDWHAFGRMLLGEGEHRGRRVLSPESVRLMTSCHVDGGPDNFFLDGQGWGFGGGVDLHPTRPWNVPGRYGWIGGTGTAGYVIGSTRTVVVFLSQLELRGPDDFAALSAVLTYAAQRTPAS